MRDRKFRGISIDGTIIYGTGYTDFLNAYPKRKGLWLWSSYSWLEIEPKTLAENTGLKDKNGVEIYKGDIINYGYFALNDTAKFGIDCWKDLPRGVNKDDISTVIDAIEVKFTPISIMQLYSMINDNPDVMGVEVIGNICENPELLKMENG